MCGKSTETPVLLGKLGASAVHFCNDLQAIVLARLQVVGKWLRLRRPPNSAPLPSVARCRLSHGFLKVRLLQLPQPQLEHGTTWKDLHWLLC